MPDKYWGVDTSYDSVTLPEAQNLFAKGVRVAFQCLWTGGEAPAVRESNIRAYAQAGIIPCGYLSVSPSRTGKAHVEAGYDSLSGDIRGGLLRHVALDVELEGLSYTQHVVQGVEALQERGYAPLVYTSYNAWVNLLGDPVPPAGWNLWNAYWDNDADYDFARLPYGGGSFILIGEQYTGGEDVDGIFADRNLFEAVFFDPVTPPLPPPPVPSPTSAIDHIELVLVNGDRRIFREVPQ